ncbi:MAG: geranylgeranylglycerol-phosphate geranylgeranyltransferase [Ignavibacteriales bacterium]|nr:geranylgeranylglycerol-phosphate geranylgeranyltransferase [Ignavibacteriales bacterium]
MFHPILQLVRPVNVVIVFVTIVVAGILAKPVGSDVVWILVAGLSGALIAAGGNAINDLFDVNVDEINRPDRPLPRETVTLDQARALWRYTSGAGLALSALLGIWNFLLAAVWVGGLYVYSRQLKGTVLIGNLTVAFMTGMAFPFGALVVGRPSLGLYPGLFAFLANLAREILKDVEDVNGDATANIETLPVKHGAGAGLLAATIVLGVLVLFTVVPVMAGVYNYTYLLFVLLVDVGLAFVGVSFWFDATLSNLRRLSLILKACMVGGLFAIFMGS